MGSKTSSIGLLLVLFAVTNAQAADLDQMDGLHDLAGERLAVVPIYGPPLSSKIIEYLKAQSP